MTYQWFKNGILLPGQTQQTLTIKGTGYYSIQVWDINGCSSISEEVQIKQLTNGVEKSDESDVTISPNPVSSIICIQGLSDLATLQSLRVTDYLGNIVLELPNNSSELSMNVDVSTFANGIYYVQLHSRDKILIKQFAVVR